jgi:hypothetical protein
MELLSTLVWFTVFFMLARFLLNLLLESKEASLARDKLLQHADMMIRIVKLEPLPEQGTILAYDLENNQYLAQGQDEDEVKQAIMQRFPEKVFVLNDRPFSANQKVKVKIEESNTR